MRVDRHQLPGYTQAVQREGELRDAAFLGEPMNIGGFDIRQMTLMDFIILDGMDCPFLRSLIPLPHELKFFLWFMSPRYRKNSPFRRWLFYRGLRKLDYATLVEEIYERYITATFQDSGANSRRSKSFTGFAATWIDLFRHEYEWPEEKTLHTALRLIYQYARAIQLRYDPNAVLFNPSDRIVREHLKKVNEENRLAMEKN